MQGRCRHAQAVLGEQASGQLTVLTSKADLAMSNVEQLVASAGRGLKKSGDLVDSTPERHLASR